MRLSTLPPLVVALALLIGAATQYPDSPAVYAFGSVGFVVLGVWLCLEVGTEVATRWRRFRDGSEP